MAFYQLIYLVNQQEISFSLHKRVITLQQDEKIKEIFPLQQDITPNYMSTLLS